MVKKVEETISSQLFKKAVDEALEHIVITDKEGKIIYANKAVSQITGYTHKEIIGKTPSLWGGQMPKEFYQSMWKTIKVDKKPFRGEVVNKKKDGSSYHAEVGIQPIVDADGNIEYFVGVERDISVYKQIEDKKEESALFFDLSIDSMIITDRESRIIRANNSFCTIIGSSASQIIGKKYMDFVHETSKSYAGELLKRLQNGETVKDAQVRTKTARGSYAVLSWQAKPYGENNIYATGRDITLQISEQQKRADLLEKYEQLNQILIGREVRMVGLKNKIARLEAELLSKK